MSKKKTVRPRQSRELEYWKGRCQDLEHELLKLNNRDGIMLEAYIGRGGFIALRDRVSKLPIKYVDDLEVSNPGDDLQEARARIIIDPQIDR